LIIPLFKKGFTPNSASWQDRILGSGPDCTAFPVCNEQALKPEKMQTASAARARMANVNGAGDISFHFHHSAPCFLRLSTWGMSCPLRIRLTLRSGAGVSLLQRP